MPNTAITVTGIGKRYRINHRVETRLAESIVASIRGSLRGTGKETSELVWALRDVSFELVHGDVVGIVGRNGAGKTTLLRILSRITRPTEGTAVLRGRVGTLLEVGTGFHPELTGRENVFLSAAILGLPRSEIVRRFDEIVAFSGVEQFIDTPVKRYSSGMQVRLGFAVAAHLEPEILFVDEVLAVGDARFQAKCLGRIEELGSSGRTVMFVSHNLQAVLRLCPKAILLEQGRLVASGPTHEVIRSYLASDQGPTSRRSWPEGQGPGDRVAKLRSVGVRSTNRGAADEVDIRDPLEVEVEYWSEDPAGLRPSANLHFYNEQGVCLFATADQVDRPWAESARIKGLIRATCHVPGNFLAEGRVTVTAAVSSFNPLVVHAVEREAIAFQVVDRSTGDGVRGEYANEWPGVVRPLLDWRVEHLAGTDPEVVIAAHRG